MRETLGGANEVRMVLELSREQVSERAGYFVLGASATRLCSVKSA